MIYRVDSNNIICQYCYGTSKRLVEELTNIERYKCQSCGKVVVVNGDSSRPESEVERIVRESLERGRESRLKFSWQ